MLDGNTARRALIKKFRKPIYREFIKAIKSYKLIESGDKIMCCVSGGKDSITLSLLMEELYEHGERNFELCHVMMNPGFDDDYVNHIKGIYDKLEMELKVFDTDIFKITKEMAADNPCFLCARMRRGALYGQAEKLGANKIALGHHMDDVVQTTLMNMFMQGSFRNMMPILDSANHPGIKLIRPLYLVDESDIIKFRDYIGLESLGCRCVLSEGKIETTRDRMRELLNNLENEMPGVKKNIQKSIENVYIDTVIKTR